MNFVHVVLHRLQILGIVMVLFEVINTLFVSHPPIYAIEIVGEHLYDG